MIEKWLCGYTVNGTQIYVCVCLQALGNGGVIVFEEKILEFYFHKEYTVYDTKLHPVVWLHFWNSKECRVTPLLSLFQGPLGLEVVMTVRITSIG